MKSRLKNILIVIIILFGAIFVILTLEPAKSPKTEKPNPIKDEEVAAHSSDQKIQAIPVTTPNEIPIIMYHHIRDFVDENDKIGTNLSVSSTKFSSQLDLIQSKGYETTTFQEIEKGETPEKPIILSFDDGYSNFYENAFPALKSRKMKAISFVITGKNNSEYMTKDQIKEIDSYGIEVGSHTVSHPDLTTISKERVKIELIDSKTALENIVGHDIISFCYPAGKQNTTVVSTAFETGYLYATTTKSTLAISALIICS